MSTTAPSDRPYFDEATTAFSNYQKALAAQMLPHEIAGDVADQVSTAALLAIAEAIHGLTGRLDRLNVRLDAIEDRIDDVRIELRGANAIANGEAES